MAIDVEIFIFVEVVQYICSNLCYVVFFRFELVMFVRYFVGFEEFEFIGFDKCVVYEGSYFVYEIRVVMAGGEDVVIVCMSIWRRYYEVVMGVVMVIIVKVVNSGVGSVVGRISYLEVYVICYFVIVVNFINNRRGMFGVFVYFIGVWCSNVIIDFIIGDF